jgi:acetylornithine deacetylase/succinyl-diaminopimelate desuccinylase-like protein
MPNLNEITLDQIQEDVKKNKAEHVDVLRRGLQASFEDLRSFQDWFADEMKRIGLDVDQFEVDPDELLEQPAQRKTLRENPSALRRGPNVVGKIAGKGPEQGILIFGHADKPPETFEWAKEHPDLVQAGNRLQGPGIADDVAGLTSMLSAVDTFKRLGLEPEGDLLIASILGKQLGVFGTYGLVTRYGPVDAAIYAHPAESGNGLGDLKMASLGMVEFHVEVEGKSPDTTEPHQTIYSKSGVSAADKGFYLAEGLRQWATEIAKKDAYRHAKLEEQTGQSFAMSIGSFTTGTTNLVYEIPTHCQFKGVVNFPPAMSLEEAENGLRAAFDGLVEADDWLSNSRATMEWGDVIAESCQSDEDSAFLIAAQKSITEVTGKTPRYNYGHSVSDLRYPMLWWNAAGLGIGPLAGDMGTPTEYVDRKEYLDTIIVFADVLRRVA